MQQFPNNINNTFSHHKAHKFHYLNLIHNFHYISTLVSPDALVLHLFEAPTQTQPCYNSELTFIIKSVFVV